MGMVVWSRTQEWGGPGVTRLENVFYSGWCFFLSFFKKDFIYLFLDMGREKEWERNIRNIDHLPLAHPLPGTWPATQACALTGN